MRWLASWPPKKPLTLSDQRLFLETGGESGIRTPDLRIMIPHKSCFLSIDRFSSDHKNPLLSVANPIVLATFSLTFIDSLS
jgi:hypothetical protein